VISSAMALGCSENISRGDDSDGQEQIATRSANIPRAYSLAWPIAGLDPLLRLCNTSQDFSG